MLTHIPASILGHRAIAANNYNQHVISHIIVTVDWHPFIEHGDQSAVIRLCIKSVHVTGHFIVMSLKTKETEQFDIKPIYIDNSDEWQHNCIVAIDENGRIGFNSAVVDFKNLTVEIK